MATRSQAAQSDPHEASLKGKLRRRIQGSYYTPAWLVEQILDTALDPLLAEAVRDKPGLAREQALLSLRVCDPACGTGNFLIAAVHRIADAVMKVRRGGLANNSQLSRATHEVCEECIFGADIDAAAVNHCRARLWSAISSAPMPRGWLKHNIVWADALGGAPAKITTPAEAEKWLALGTRFGGKRGSASQTVPRPASRSAPPLHWGVQLPTVFGPSRKPAGFDLVIGNPPFLGQLKLDLARTRNSSRQLERRFNGALTGYADQASAFLLLAVEVAAPQGMVALLQPQSLLAAGDCGSVRRAVLECCALESLWHAQEQVFKDASPFVCLPFLRRCRDQDGMARSGAELTPGRAGAGTTCAVPITVGRNRGTGDHNQSVVESSGPHPTGSETWSGLLAASSGVPVLPSPGPDCIADVARVTADFRDQYYGLEGCIRDLRSGATVGEIAAGFAPLVTVGLVDLAHCKWGHQPCRVLKRAWSAPCVDLTKLGRDPLLGRWAAARLVPKVMVATQTRVLEACVDERGVYLPSTPLLTAQPNGALSLWMLAAAIASPVTCIHALTRWMGAGLHCDAIKLSASQLMALPLPTCGSQWKESALWFREASGASDAQQRSEALLRFAQCSCLAHRLPAGTQDRVLDWWCARSMISQ